MKEFGLSVLKSIVSYLILFVMAFVGLVSLTSGEFPPSKKALLAGVERLKKSYNSLATMQDMLPKLRETAMEAGGDSKTDPHSSEKSAGENQANPLQAMQALLGNSGASGGGSADSPDLAASMALLQGMMQQMAAAQGGNAGQGYNPSASSRSAGSQDQPMVIQLDANTLKQLTKIEQQNNELLQRMSRIQTYLLGLHEYLKQTRQPAATGAAAQPQRR